MVDVSASRSAVFHSRAPAAHNPSDTEDIERNDDDARR
jgi:hypothetical protein